MNGTHAGHACTHLYSQIYNNFKISLTCKCVPSPCISAEQGTSNRQTSRQVDQGHRDESGVFCTDFHDWLSPADHLYKHRRYRRFVMNASDLDNT